jgi:hypothetical protein
MQVKLASKHQQVTIQGYSDQGGWLITTDYVVDELVNDTGVEYVCIVAHTSTAADRPGVGANWEDFWEVLDSTTDPFEMQYYSKAIFHMPDTWSAADIGFKVAEIADGVYLPLYMTDGNLEAITPAVDRSYAFPSSVAGAKYVKLWSNSAGTDVLQAADRVILLDFKT